MGLIDGLQNVPERFKRCCSSLAPPPTNNSIHHLYSSSFLSLYFFFVVVEEAQTQRPRSLRLQNKALSTFGVKSLA